MKHPNVWKLQDAKARLSEVIRQARAGAPQRITVHGKEAALLLDPDRFEVSPKRRSARTMADFIARSKKYRGVTEGIALARHTGTHMRDKRQEIFDGDYSDED
jgi:prevent-host-death family protein